MRRITYVMHFTGQASRHTNGPDVLRTNGSAASCVIESRIVPSGVESSLRATDGELAFVESELRMTGADTFQESGEISFGDEGKHVLRFSTLGQGHISEELEPGVRAGTVSWKVEGGEGQFNGAGGFITSNFTINETGERNDFQCGLIFLPESRRTP